MIDCLLRGLHPGSHAANLQLVPPLTNRANYVHWIEDLLELSRPEGQVRGLDIGTGANCIYALLGAALCGWHMVGADVTEEAAAAAARNVAANPDLRNLLEIRHVMPPPGVSHGSVRFSPAAPRVQPSQLPEHAEDLVALEVATAAGAKGGKKPNADQAKKVGHVLTCEDAIRRPGREGGPHAHSLSFAPSLLSALRSSRIASAPLPLSLAVGEGYHSLEPGAPSGM